MFKEQVNHSEGLRSYTELAEESRRAGSLLEQSLDAETGLEGDEKLAARQEPKN